MISEACDKGRMTPTCLCGSLIRGNTQEIHLASYPPGASGEVDGMSIQTPAKLMLTRNEPRTVVLEAKGNWCRQSCTQFADGWILKSVVRPRK